MSVNPATWTDADHSYAGRWQLVASHPDVGQGDITVLRGVPTSVDSAAFADPGGPREAQIAFPAVSALDKLGTGDLALIREEANIDLIWDGPLPDHYPW